MQTSWPGLTIDFKRESQGEKGVEIKICHRPVKRGDVSIRDISLPVRSKLFKGPFFKAHFQSCFKIFPVNLINVVISCWRTAKLNSHHAIVLVGA